MVALTRRCLIGIVGSCRELRLPPLCVSRTKRAASRGFSPVRDGSIVAEAAAACGFWTVWIGKRSARAALAASRAAALRGIGLRRIRPRRTRAAIGLRMRRHRPEGHGQNTQACDNAQGALHLDLPLRNERGSRQRPYEANVPHIAPAILAPGRRLVWRFRSPHHCSREFVMRTSEPKATLEPWIC